MATVTPKATEPADHAAAMTSTDPTLRAGWPSASSIGKPSKIDELKDAEDKVQSAMGEWPTWIRAIAYKYLHNSGLRMADVEELIRKRAK